ncbi:MAG: molybdopterin biosynthesis protein [Tissierellia bacterium]|nr:molybdopterin biosynthesis protein [Tissierellia bacterium]
MRNVYLSTKSLEEARNLLDRALEGFYKEKKTEIIDVRSALGRVSAAPVFARLSSPYFHSCAMDGIMVESKTTLDARKHRPLLLKEGDYLDCDTGDPLLSPYDSVIMAEDLVVADEGFLILEPTHPWEHVRPMGEDIIEKDLLFTVEHIFSPVDLSVLLASGIEKIEVYKKPEIVFIPTGDEIVDGHPQKGQIIESNTAMLEALAQLNGGISRRLSISRDDKEILLKAVKNNLDADIIVMIAGSSAGRDDLTSSICEKLGQLLVHGIDIKPGKPAVLGVVGGKPFIGLPGYPVSTHIVYEELVVPILRKRAHLPKEIKPVIKGTLTRRVVSSLSNQEYVRVRLGRVDGSYKVTPMDRGAGASLSLARSDGYLIVPRNSEGMLRGEEVEVRMHSKLQGLEDRLVVIGSHDMVLELINDIFAEQGKRAALISSHVGSLAGLQSLKERECHLAPSHLLGSDGRYNYESMDLFFKGERMAMINVVGRRQGLIVPKGNPKKIESMADLAGKTMINRQRGAGTRVLFDHLLEKEGINPDEIAGYDNEATTHLAVALAVSEGDVDFGVGIEAAAKTMGCDFVFLADEAYEFIAYEDSLKEDQVKELLELLKSDEFKSRVQALGGYSTQDSGSVKFYEG